MLGRAYQEVMGNNQQPFGTPNETQIHIDKKLSD